ncbi:MAG: arylsulfatase [Planctomyces sp.]|nr:arylsulfatase [Planctomyces sp.]
MRMRLVLLILLVCGWWSNAAFAAELAGSRPNIILIITDDQGYGPIGRHGHPWLRTPAIDRLHDESTRFSRFLVCPTCSPTRSAIMTGRHSMRNGITHTILERERMTLNAVTLPQSLRDAGYRTAIFGKWHLGDEDEYQPGRRGFDEVFIHGAGGIGQAYQCSCADVPNNGYFDPIVRHNGRFVKTHGFCTDVFFQSAIEWIGVQKDSRAPCFAYIATNAPHGPFLAPEANKQRFLKAGFTDEQAGYYGMIENIDHNVGLMMDRLKDWDLLKNTVVIFMSDNGMTGGGSGPAAAPMGKGPDGIPWSSWNAGMKGLKGSPDEGGVRVPFFISWRDRIPAGLEIDRIAAHIDIFPTLAAMAGAAMPEGQIEGRSLLPLIEQSGGEWSDRFLYTHVGRWNTGENPDDYQWKQFSVRTQKYRMVNNTELFDMETDPGQTTNLADKHPELMSEMRMAYDKWWKETRPMMVNENAPMSKIRPYHQAFEQQKALDGIPDWIPSATNK